MPAKRSSKKTASRQSSLQIAEPEAELVGSDSPPTSFAINTIRQADCIEAMEALPAGCVDLAFADPPFNIGYDYDVYDDRKEHLHYLAWSKTWIAAVHRVLKDTGTFWLAIGDEYAAELKLAARTSASTAAVG